MRATPIACTLALLLAACGTQAPAEPVAASAASAPAEPAAMPEPTPPADAPPATDAVPPADAGAAHAQFLRPGMVMTMDYRPDRLVIVLDDAGRVESARCG